MYADGYWHIGRRKARVLILAIGEKTNQFIQTKHLPLKAMRGQMTRILTTAASLNLRIPLCAEGHILPSINGQHDLGATYTPHLTEADCLMQDDNVNVRNLKSIPSTCSWSGNIVGHWAGVRAATPDYLPLIGPVANEQLFKERFSRLATNSKRWIPLPGTYYPDLYVCAGFGSRGLTTIPLSAEYLAGHINQEPACLKRSMIQALSPSRFLRRQLIQSARMSEVKDY